MKSIFIVMYKKHLEATTEVSSVKKVLGKCCLSNWKITVKEVKF